MLGTLRQPFSLPTPDMSKPTTCPVLPDEGQRTIAKVQRVNQRWIVHGKLRDNASAYLAHLQKTDPARLQKGCAMALHMVQHKKTLIRDPKPLFYAGLFSAATRGEIDLYLRDHPMTRAISLMLHGDKSGRIALPEQARKLADGIAAEIRQASAVA